MILADAALLLLGLLGHAGIWIGLINRLHGVAFPRPVVRWFTLVFLCALGVIPLAWVAGLYIHDLAWVRPTTWARLPLAARGYGWLCSAVGLLGFLRWCRYRLPRYEKNLCQVQASERVSPAAGLSQHPVMHPLHRAFTRIPGNQCLQLEIVEKTIEVPRLPQALDGLVIAHLTDLHYTGNINREYFQEIARLTNQLNPDLIAITGDLVDKSHCIDWLPDTLGRLSAPHGVYAILGNHDLRVKRELGRLRQTIADAGIVYLGGTWQRVDIAGTRVLMAGNEQPWIRPAADAPDCPPPGNDDCDFRLLLSHSPDQMGWARRRGFDLMLAGHTHGGQIRLPVVGALLCPSLYGVKYDCGVFHEPPTVLHVSRGLSGVDPLRFFCAPELVRLVLRAPRKRDAVARTLSADAEPATAR